MTANQGEAGIHELCELLLARGVEIEAGLPSVPDAQKFVVASFVRRCVRALIEPLDPNPEEGLANAEAIERVLSEAGLRLEQVHHGDGIASWAVNRACRRSGS